MESSAIQYKCAYCGTCSLQEPYCCAGCEALHSFSATNVSTRVSAEFSYLDQPNFKELYRQTSSKNEFVFFAKGMHCSSCVHLLEKLPQYCDSVKSARVHYPSSTLKINLTENGSLSEAASAIKALGYKPEILAPEEPSQKRQRDEDRQALKRIAVAGFCAGNTMLFVVPIYAGLVGELKTVFNWLSFLLFLPVLLYSSQPFFKGAARSLSYRVISVDLPIAIALSAGFIFSTLNLIRGDGAIYFDSTASFLFLILCARYWLKAVQANHLATPSLQSALKHEKYIRLDAKGKAQIVPFTSVKTGDQLLIAAGQTLPSECKLLSKSALMDLSLFNGESLPKRFTEGLTLLGGTKNLQQQIKVEVTAAFNDSKIGSLCRQLESNITVKNRFTQLADRLAQQLIIVVFSIAVLFFLFYMSVDVSEAFNRSLALIVLACPCALAFGAPLTYSFAMRTALRRGIFIKDPNVFEKLLTIKNIFFDKTGTLTEGQLRLIPSENTEISDEFKGIMLGLEAKSYHPIAFALREAWGERVSIKNVHDVKEVLGSGVSGTFEGKQYQLRTLAEGAHESEVAVELLENGTSVARFYFADTLRADTRNVVRSLQDSGLQTFIVSGDRTERCLSVATECGIPSDHVYGELYPEDKNDILQKYKNTCMLGDGANDALSLQTADVGIAVKGSVDLSLTHSDMYFTRGGLSPFLELLKISRQTRHVLRRNLTLSLIYNLIGAVLALGGFINPMLAAILMPISSAAVVFSSLWGFR